MTYLLVHGGGTTARFWDRILPFLDQPVFAVDLPGRNGKPGDLATLTVEAEEASVVADVEAAGLQDPIILVAHSSGGLVVPGVVARLKGRVAHVVLNGALIPPEGGCALDCMRPRHREGLSAAWEQARQAGTVITLPGPPANPESFRLAYGGEPLDDAALAYMTDPVRCVQDALNHYFLPVRWSAAADVPVTYILNEKDRPVPVELQEEMITRLPHPATVIRLDTGHLPAVTEPRRFAEVLAGISRMYG